MNRLLPFLLLTWTAGCGGASNGPPRLIAVEDSYVFDTVLGPPSKHTFEFVNDGGGTTGTLTASVSGDVTQLTITSDGCTYLALTHGKRCAVEVQLSGDEPTNYSGQLHVGTLDDQVAVELSGHVGPSQLLVTLPKKSSVVFGGAAQADVTLSNVGGAQSGVLTTDDPNHVVVADGCSGAPLKGGASCKMTVKVTSLITDVGPTDNVQLTLDEADGTPLDIIVTFTVVLAKAPISSDGEFGAQVPADAPNKSVYVFSGDQTAVNQIQVAWMSGENSAGTSPFVITNDHCSGTSTSTNTACTVDIGVDPTLPAPADYTAKLVVTSLGRAPLTVPLHVHTSLTHVTLTLATTGSGSGYIVGPLGDYCDKGAGPCGSIVIGDGAPTRFSVSPEIGSKFVRWSEGPCAGSTDYTCAVTPNGANLSLAAEFALQ